MNKLFVALKSNKKVNLFSKHLFMHQHIFNPSNFFVDLTFCCPERVACAVMELSREKC